MSHQYDDIINLPHHRSKKHPHMSLHDRAAQFAPFAALTGHNDAIRETARLTEEKIELDEETLMRLNERLQVLQDHIKEQPEISITYFVPDEKKAGGVYVTKTGVPRRIDVLTQSIVMQDKTVIMIEDILIIEGEIFNSFDEY